MTDDERAIRELVETWLAATRAGDVETVLGLMSDDVVFMVAGQAPFGKEVFQTAAAAPADMRIDGKSDILEINVLDGWAYMRTHLEVTMTPAGGQPVRRSGHTLTILRKQPDGRWVIARDANLLTVADAV